MKTTYVVLDACEFEIIAEFSTPMLAIECAQAKSEEIDQEIIVARLGPLCRMNPDSSIDDFEPVFVSEFMP